MAESKKLITIFAATGNQGSSVIESFLSKESISSHYHLRGTTRDKNSSKAKALTAKEVEMVNIDLDSQSSIAAAVAGSYGVYINTDYWTLLNKDAEIKQGKDIFQACLDAKVHHVVLSALPYVTKLSEGKYTGVAHFDSKAIVAEWAAGKKGDTIVSYFLPAMYMENIKQVMQNKPDGSAIITLPYPDPEVAWPLLSPSRDSGNYIVGLFKAGDKADGVAVQAVSEWITPNRLAEELGAHLGKKVTFVSIPPKVYEQHLPENIRDELSEMMQWIGDASYYGKGTEKQQADSNKWLISPESLTTWKKFAELEF